MIGHNGSEIKWPDLPEPRNRRGFLTQEFVDVAFECGYYMMDIWQPEMWDGHNLDSRILIDNFPQGRTFEDRILYYMSQASGLIIGHYNAVSKHMVAWEHTTRRIFDPGRGIYHFDNEAESIIVENFLPVFRIKS